eukprot:TRINITY_DN3068_c0_g1_i3.p1 TRINITY_DN3068_c0_g1~~TRINITY_DN3068_c0_g1_i3.p1  ORF type:complete len:158 (+),score=35.26 TRINITY_DN3068_c0_g1_i3:212-685(+)
MGAWTSKTEQQPTQKEHKEEVNKKEEEANKQLETLEFPVLKIPLDVEGYCLSFSLEQEKDYLQFFDEFGFVIINDILTPTEVEETVAEIWDYLESRPWGWEANEKISRNDPTTWNNNYWPGGTKLGILDSQPCIDKCAFRNSFFEHHQAKRSLGCVR